MLLGAFLLYFLSNKNIEIYMDHNKDKVEVNTK